jgi:hypothetical protein
MAVEDCRRHNNNAAALKKNTCLEIWKGQRSRGYAGRSAVSDGWKSRLVLDWSLREAVVRISDLDWI